MNLGEPELLFARFQQGARTVSGARAEFELFVLDLVKVQAATANTVKGKGGRDWGIDTLVGSFASGDLAIWQCKFVLKWDDDSPRRQVTDSFKSAVRYAKEKGYKIAAWTLCVPGVLSGDEQLWFDKWIGRQKRATGIEISLWNGYELRHQLLRENARHVRAEYFPDTLPAGGGPVPVAERPLEDVAETADLAQFDHALFVRQLHAAGEAETDAARGLYYATDALVRDYEAKADTVALAALKELHLDAQRVWTEGYNAEEPDADENGRMPALHPRVMAAVEARPDPAGLQLRGVHKMGAVHRLVEDARAGWVTHWRQVAAEHADDGSRSDQAQRSTELLPAQPAGTPAANSTDGAVTAGAAGAAADIGGET